MELSIKEKLTWINQFKILHQLLPNEGYEEKVKILECGYTREYYKLTRDISEIELSKEECDEVNDICEMHRALGDSYKRLSAGHGINKEDIEFMGFDGNNESRYLYYVQYLIEEANQWQELSKRYLNSVHTLEMYRRMLNQWEGYGRRYDLSEPEIKTIIKARQYSR